MGFLTWDDQKVDPETTVDGNPYKYRTINGERISHHNSTDLKNINGELIAKGKKKLGKIFGIAGTAIATGTAAALAWVNSKVNRNAAAIEELQNKECNPEQVVIEQTVNCNHETIVNCDHECEVSREEFEELKGDFETHAGQCCEVAHGCKCNETTKESAKRPGGSVSGGTTGDSSTTIINNIDTNTTVIIECNHSGCDCNDKGDGGGGGDGKPSKPSFELADDGPDNGTQPNPDSSFELGQGQGQGSQQCPDSNQGQQQIPGQPCPDSEFSISSLANGTLKSFAGATFQNTGSHLKYEPRTQEHYTEQTLGE